ncbi:MAG TPA: ATP-binding protein [Verrucomicrobiae bacterium]|nr:ATP-binding protein [Verrucomicrobiae bacterium]
MPWTRSQGWLLRFAQFSGIALVCIGTVVLCGWVANLPGLASWTASGSPMNPLSALLFMLGGMTLLRRTARLRKEGRDWFSGIASAILIVGGAIKFGECFGWQSTAAAALYQMLNGINAGFPTHEIATASALGFVLCGLGLGLMDYRTSAGYGPARACLLASLFLSLLALVGYAFRVLPLYSIGSTIPMPLASAVSLGLISAGGLAARPDSGFMRLITSDTTAGATARRLLPAALLIPLILGAIRFTGARHGVLESEFGTSLFVVANIVLFALLIWWNSRMLFAAEQERTRAERRLAVQYGVTRILAEATDVSAAMQSIVRSICDCMGWDVGEVWRVDDNGKLIRCEHVYTRSLEFDHFAEITCRLALSQGTGLPGRSWEKREAIWLADINSSSQQFSRAIAVTEAGLRSAIVFPIRFNGSVCGVFEFFSARSQQPDDALLQTLTAIGYQIGQFADRKQAEDQLKRTSADLARSNTELQQFAYVASHDLSEPLRMIVSYLQLLVSRHRARLDAEAMEFIGYAVDGAERMQKLIHDLLAYARVDSKAREFQPTDCNQVLAGVLLNLKVIIDETAAAIEHETLPTVLGDAIQLTQVFQNLISNAIKFRGPRPPHITISAEPREGEWLFKVADNGIGIDARNFERVFVIFQRLHTRQEYPGTGIGLAICKKIIERHGGRIWVESEPGQGTTFWFTIPART